MIIIVLIIISIIITIIIMISNIVIYVDINFSLITRNGIPNAIVATTETILIFTHHFWYTRNYKFN